MTVPPLIQLMHASDAPHHVAELKLILMRMKSENRISDCIVHDLTLEAVALSLKEGNYGGIIVLLTDEVQQSRKEIEHSLMGLNLNMEKLRLIEIIVDNVPYNNNFISFPQDLQPIRSRDDMNLVWKGIEQDLQVIFPKVITDGVEQPQQQPVEQLKYLKLFGLGVLNVFLGLIFLGTVAPHVGDETFIVCGLISFLLPFIVFLLEKGKLELTTVPTKQEQWITGAINWKHLLITTCIASALFLVTLIVYALILMIIGISPVLSPLPALLTASLFLLYKRKSKSSPNENLRQSSVKRFLIFFGALSLCFFIGWILRSMIFENVFEQTANGSDEVIHAVLSTFFSCFFSKGEIGVKHQHIDGPSFNSN